MKYAEYKCKRAQIKSYLIISSLALTLAQVTLGAYFIKYFN